MEIGAGSFGARAGVVRFVDTCRFSGPHEADVLWVKLNVEDHLFHEWIAVENGYTHQGQYKGYHLNELIHADDRFAPFLPKLHVIECDIKPDFKVGSRKVFDDDAIRIERAQRESAVSYLLDRYDDQDYVLISDVDECLDTEDPKRRRLLRRKVAGGKDIVLVPRIRYQFDYDNRWLARRSVPLVSIRQLKRDGRLNSYRQLGTPEIWKHDMVFEYSYCYSTDGILRKFESFIHTGYEPPDIELALRHNHSPVSPNRARRLGWRHEDWFVKRRLNSRNSPAFVRDPLAELKTNVLSPDYRQNRLESYPQFFPKSRLARARRWTVLYSKMYSDFATHKVRNSRRPRLSRTGRRILSALRRSGRLARIKRFLQRRHRNNMARG